MPNFLASSKTNLPRLVFILKYQLDRTILYFWTQAELLKSQVRTLAS